MPLGCSVQCLTLVMAFKCSEMLTSFHLFCFRNCPSPFKKKKEKTSEKKGSVIFLGDGDLESGGKLSALGPRVLEDGL